MAGRRGFKQLHTFDGEALGQSCSGRHSFKWHLHLSQWKFETRRKRWYNNVPKFRTPDPREGHLGDIALLIHFAQKLGGTGSTGPFLVENQ